MSVLDFEHTTRLPIQQPGQDQANQERITEPVAWTVVTATKPDVVEQYGDGEAEDIIGTIYNGEVMVEFDVDKLSRQNNKPTIVGAARPQHWQHDSFSEEVRQAHYIHGFMDAFQAINFVNPDVDQISVSLVDRYVSRLIIEVGRPKGWIRSYNFWGRDFYGIDRHDQTITDAADALQWSKNGGQLEIVYSKLLPLRLVGRAAVGAYLKAV